MIGGGRGVDRGTAVLLCVLASGSPHGDARGGIPSCTAVGGLICKDTTWTAGARPYCVTSSIIIGCGATLTIEPSVIVCFPRGLFGIATGSGAFGEGTLVARGTEGSPIVFTSCEPDARPGDWVSLNFTDAAVDAAFDVDGMYLNGSILQHTVVEFAGAGNPSGAVMATGSSPYIADSLIRANATSGIYISEADAPRLASNSVSGNMAQSSGGGVYLLGCLSPMLANTTVTGNTATDGSGGGIRLDFCSGAVLTGNWISGNSAAGGGGISLVGTHSTTMTDNVITENYSGSSGGGVDLSNCLSPTLRGNVIGGNVALGAGGGGVALRDSPRAALTANIITGNTGSNGGGVLIAGSIGAGGSTRATLMHNSITRNLATSKGGGIYLDSVFSPSYLTGDVIVRNSAHEDGGGLFVLSCTDCAIRDSVVANNATLLGDAGGGIHVVSSPGLALGGALDEGSVVLLGNLAFDVLNGNAFGPVESNISAEKVWWGTCSSGEIENRVWDFFDDATRAIVDWSPPATTGPFDFNGDGDIRDTDLPGFVDCLRGPGAPIDKACTVGDLDRDGDVDLFDFAVFQTVVRVGASGCK